MSIRLLFLFLILSLAAIAQENRIPQPAEKKQPYQPTKWYLGIKYESIPYSGSYARPYTGGIVVGYNFYNRFALQLGLTPVYLQGFRRPSLPRATLLPPIENYTGPVLSDDYSPGLYVPLMLRYSFFRPFRRFQPYALAGIHAYLASFQRTLYAYENGQLSGTLEKMKRQSYSGVGAAVGLGMRIRTVHRFSIYGEATLGRSFQKNSAWGNILQPSDYTRYSGTLGLGILYDFR